jgi:hypothetical protein
MSSHITDVNKNAIAAVFVYFQVADTYLSRERIYINQFQSDMSVVILPYYSIYKGYSNSKESYYITLIQSYMSHMLFNGITIHQTALPFRVYKIVIF